MGDNSGGHVPVQGSPTLGGLSQVPSSSGAVARAGTRTRRSRRYTPYGRPPPSRRNEATPSRVPLMQQSLSLSSLSTANTSLLSDVGVMTPLIDEILMYDDVAMGYQHNAMGNNLHASSSRSGLVPDSYEGRTFFQTQPLNLTYNSGLLDMGIENMHGGSTHSGFYTTDVIENGIFPTLPNPPDHSSGQPQNGEASRISTSTNSSEEPTLTTVSATLSQTRTLGSPSTLGAHNERSTATTSTDRGGVLYPYDVGLTTTTPVVPPRVLRRLTSSVSASTLDNCYFGDSLDTQAFNNSEESLSDLLVVPGSKRKYTNNILNISLESDTQTPEGHSPARKRTRRSAAPPEVSESKPPCTSCHVMFPHHKKSCSEMKVVKCKFYGCRWLGRRNDLTLHSDSCVYGNASGKNLVELLKRTRFKARPRAPTPDIDRTILPLFESKRLAAIDFEIKDVLQTLKQQAHGSPSSSGSDGSSSEDAGLDILVELASSLILGQHPNTDLFPASYQGSWTIYESGTAHALGEVISVKVSANIAVNYRLFLTYSINFHDKVSSSFYLGHVLLDGSKEPGNIIPHAYGTTITPPDDSRIMAEVPQGRSNSQVVTSTQPASIFFSAPVNMYQVLLGKRRVGFRLFLFEGPPNEELIGTGRNKIPSAFSGDMSILGNPPRISSDSYSPMKHRKSSTGKGIRQVLGKGRWPF